MASNSALSSAQRTVGNPVTVVATKLDDITADDAEVDFVKCDVEGGEMMVLRGSRELRSREKPPVWLLEANETFLVETGAPYEALHDELSMFGPVGYYRAHRRVASPACATACRTCGEPATSMLWLCRRARRSRPRHG